MDYAHDVFYNDMPEAQAAQPIADLRPHSSQTGFSPSPKAAWQEAAYAGQLAYITCKDDHCVPLSMQAAKVEGSGVSFQVVQLESGHCPFLSCPQQLATTVTDLARAFDSQ